MVACVSTDNGKVTVNIYKGKNGLMLPPKSNPNPEGTQRVAQNPEVPRTKPKISALGKISMAFKRSVAADDGDKKASDE